MGNKETHCRYVDMWYMGITEKVRVWSTSAIRSRHRDLKRICDQLENACTEVSGEAGTTHAYALWWCSRILSLSVCVCLRVRLFHLSPSFSLALITFNANRAFHTYRS